MGVEVCLSVCLSISLSLNSLDSHRSGTLFWTLPDPTQPLETQPYVEGKVLATNVRYYLVPENHSAAAAPGMHLCPEFSHT